MNKKESQINPSNQKLIFESLKQDILSLASIKSKFNDVIKKNHLLNPKLLLKSEKNNISKKRIRDRIELYIHQKGQIEEKSAKTQDLEKEINMQNNTIKERIDMNKKKVDKLENKYDEVYKKLINIEVNCEDKKIKNMIINNLYIIDENDKKNEKVNEKSKEKKNIQQKIEDLMCFGCHPLEKFYINFSNNTIFICEEFAMRLWNATDLNELNQPTTIFDNCGFKVDFLEDNADDKFIIPSQKWKSFFEFFEDIKIPLYEDFVFVLVPKEGDVACYNFAMFVNGKFLGFFIFFWIFLFV